MMRIVKMFGTWMLLMLFVLWPAFPQPQAEENSGDGIRALIKDMKNSYAKLAHMQCRFTKDLVIEGRRVPKTVLRFKFKKQPKTIYLEFINRFAGRKCLYIEGENDNKMLVRPEGVWRFMTFKVDPMDKRAMVESSEPITKMGFGTIIETVETWYQRSLTDPEVKIEFADDYQENGRPYYRLFGKTESGEDFLLLLIDRKTYSPFKLEYRYRDSYGLFLYENIEINGGLTDRDFEI